MAYFDAHFHPSFKSFMSNDIGGKRNDCWHVFNHLYNLLDSQSSLSQSYEGKVGLGVAAIITLESPYAQNLIIQLAKYLSFFDPDMLNRSTGPEDWSFFWNEINHLEESLSKSGHEEKAQIIRTFSDFDQDKMNLVLAIEGAHSLNENGTSLLDNLVKLKTNTKYRFLYMTLVHQTRFATCNHSFTVRMLDGNKEFWPEGTGITKLGYQLIDACLDTLKGGYQILIDVKHMSLTARKQFYKYRTSKYKDVPIIASHVAVTGLSYVEKDMQSKIRHTKLINDGKTIKVIWEKPKGIQRTDIRTWDCEFNPWSMNLYNEEIEEIVQSDGLIGLILDRRALGAQGISGEYFDYSDFTNELKLKETRGGVDQEDEEDEGLEENYAENKENVMARTNATKHLWHFCNQIFHIVACAGIDAWKHISIGSDFDGMISPIKPCISTAEFSDLEDNLKKMLLEMLERAPKYYPNLSKEKFGLTAANVDERVRGIMYNNGYNFVKKHFARGTMLPIVDPTVV